MNKEERRQFFLDKGYIIGVATGAAYKEFKDYAYQGDGCIKYAQTCNRVLELSDEEFEKEIILLPAKEVEAQRQLDEYVNGRKQAKLNEENERTAELVNRDIDAPIYWAMVETMTNIIKGNPMKSKRYSDAANQLINELNKEIE